MARKVKPGMRGRHKPSGKMATVVSVSKELSFDIVIQLDGENESRDSHVWNLLDPN